MITETCTSGKVPYRSRKAALKAINGQQRGMKKYGNMSIHKGEGGKTAYRCPECQEWHMTAARWRG